MGVEQLVNHLVLTLADNGGEITSSQTTFNISSAAGVPSTGQWRGVLETALGNGTGEIVLVTEVSDETLTVIRNYETNLGAESNPQSFPDGSYLTLQMTAGSVVKVALQNPYVFSGHASETQTLTAGTPAVLAVDTVDFDDADGFDTSTHIYTVPIAGRYRVSGQVKIASVAASPEFWLLQNGTYVKRGTNIGPASVAEYVGVSIDCLISCDEGDTLSLYVVSSSVTSTTQIDGAAQDNYFDVQLVNAT